MANALLRHDTGPAGSGTRARLDRRRIRRLIAERLRRELELRAEARGRRVLAELQRRAQEDPAGEIMATTTVVLLARGEHFACLWAGDSRAYLLRDGVLCQVTHDHSLVQEMVEAGSLAPEDAESHPQANIITRAVGSQEPLELDKVAGRLQPGDVLLLCTDGFYRAVDTYGFASDAALVARAREASQCPLRATSEKLSAFRAAGACRCAHGTSDR